MNFTAAMEETIMFKTSEVGLIVSGANESNAITARYPEAPACPTDEYNVAMVKKSKNAMMISNVMIVKLVFP